MVWWKAVSNTATWGTPGPMTAEQALTPRMLAGLCRGARGMHASMADSTWLSMRTEWAKVSPPWTTR